MIKYLNDEDFNNEVSTGKKLVDFYADWCGPCRMMGEVLEDVTDIDILKVNVDKFPLIAQQFGVMSIPTLLLFENGELKKSNVGFLDIDEIKEFIK